MTDRTGTTNDLLRRVATLLLSMTDEEVEEALRFMAEDQAGHRADDSA